MVKNIRNVRKKLKVSEENINDHVECENIGEGKGSDSETSYDARRHKMEIDSLKESDPEFYKFLLENDAELVNFDENDFNDSVKQKKEELQTKVQSTKDLSKKEFRRILKHSDESMKNLSGLISCYRSAVRCLLTDDIFDEKKFKNLLKARTYVIEENLAREIILDCIPAIPKNLSNLLKQKEKKIPKKILRQDVSLVQSFWINTVFLLNLYGNKIFENKEDFKVLLVSKTQTPSGDSSKSWTVRNSQMDECFAGARSRFDSQSSDQGFFNPWKIRNADSELAAVTFAAIESLVIMIGKTEFHDNGGTDSKSQLRHKAFDAQETILHASSTAFLKLIDKIGYSWKTALGCQESLMLLSHLYENIHPKQAAKCLYNSVRRIAMISRNYVLARSYGSKKMLDEAIAKSRRLKMEKTCKQIFCWSYLKHCDLITKIMCNLSKANSAILEIANPFSVILLGATNSNLQSVQHAPWTFQCLFMLCELMEKLSLFIPVASHIIVLGETLVKHQMKFDVDSKPLQLMKGKKYRNLKSVSREYEGKQVVMESKTDDLKLVAKPVDLDIVVLLSRSQLNNSVTAENLVIKWIELTITFASLLAHHPSFPEVIEPIEYQVKQLSKCKNAKTRNELKQLLNQIHSAKQYVTQKRSTIDINSKPAELLFMDNVNCSLTQKHKEILKKRIEKFKLFASSNEKIDDENDDSNSVTDVKEESQVSIQKTSEQIVTDNSNSELSEFTLESDDESQTE